MMLEIQRINITLPKKLVNKAKVLIDEGLYANFSELIREGIRNELLLDQKLMEKKRILEKWFKDEKGKGIDTSVLTQEELFERIRKIRNDIWEEKYEGWFERLKK